MTGDADRDWLAILVHEVRSPVAALSAIAEAYREADSDARRSLASLAIAACSGIERMISDVHVNSVVREPVDVGRVVADAVTSARLRGGDVRAEVEPGLPPVQADPHRLRQAIDNLISNALTHAAGGKIRVAASAEDGTLVVSVVDSGPGIAPENLERIFEAGVRLDHTRPGSGLGLSVARAIIEAHGGALAVESTPGAGSTFALRLPARPG